ncbi:hypothetical protein MIR68_003176 [Amoeboaphelidium protococcarum]|nr:hypothetical protein MIR68_003176 [Amoeboaphelidium protococcarum]
MSDFRATTPEGVNAEMLHALHNAQVHNEQLQQQIAAYENQRLSTPAQVPVSVEQNSVILPSKYNGERELFRGFRNQLTILFKIHPQRYKSDEIKIMTVISLLSGNALQWVNPILEHPSKYPDTLANYDRFMSALAAAFQPIEQMAIAGNRIKLLKQLKKTASVYSTEFLSLASDLDWNDSALMFQYKDGLSYQVKKMLLGYPEPSKLQELIDLSIRCDQRLSLFHAANGRVVNNQLFQNIANNRIPQVGPANNHQVVPAAVPVNNPDAMEIDQIQRGRLSPEERARRIANNLCIVCGQTGHWRRDCPLAVHNRPARRAQAILLLDCGADVCFVSQKLVDTYKIPVVQLKQSITVKFADGNEDHCTKIIHQTTPLQLHIGEHIETITFLVTQLSQDIILGMSWLKQHNPLIDWIQEKVTFNSDFCVINCVVHETSVYSNAQSSSSVRLEQESLKQPAPKVSFNLNSMVQSNNIEMADSHLAILSNVDSSTQTEQQLKEINSPSSASSATAVKVSTEIQVDVSEIQSLVEEEKRSIVLEIDDLYTQMRDISEVPNNTDHVNQELPKQIADYQTVFDKKMADQLPPHRASDCTIDLKPDSEPFFGKVYSLTKEEDFALKEWLQNNIDKGFIRPSKSPFGAPCFYVKKPDWTGDKKLRLCMDYRALNKNTIKNKNPMPLVSDIFRTLQKAKMFTTLDLVGAYNLLRIKEGHEFKSAFRTKYGSYEFLVMPFGLANAPAQFQTFMNELLKDQIGNFVIVFIDDIIIYSDNEDEHWQHVREVLEILRQNNLYCNIAKCHFAQRECKYLGYVLSKDGLSMDLRKVEAVLKWPNPKNVNEVQMLLGFLNFYRRLIKNFAKLTMPFTLLLKKDVQFCWGEEQKAALEQMKKVFADPQFLMHPNEEKPFIVETDSSDFAIAGVLSQYDENGELRPVAFYSRQMIPAERNYEIYDKELLAIHECFKEWRHFLQGADHQVTVLSDHKNLQYFMETKQLTRRQARWATFFAEFDFVLTYRPGNRNGKADILSRRPDYYVENDKANFLRIIDPNQVVNALSLAVFGSVDQTVTIQEIEPVNQLDWPLYVKKWLVSGEWKADLPVEVLQLCKDQSKHFSLDDSGNLCRIADDGITKSWYLHPSSRLEQLERLHDKLGHLKNDSIAELIQRRYWWPKMDQEIKDYISRCAYCQLDKSQSTSVSSTPIKPVPPVALPFERWGIDFVQDLSEAKSGNKHIITAIDYATRWVIAKAVPNRDAKTVANFIYHEIVMNFGAPFEIISDRGSSFLDEGVKYYEKKWNIKHLATSPYHPQTNGMIERMHAMLRHAIATLAAGNPSRWDEYLAEAVFGIRVRTHAVTKSSPFYLMFGVNPRIPGDTHPPLSSMKPLDELEEIEVEGAILARTFEEMGNARRAAYERSLTQAELMRKRYNLDHNAPEYFFKVGDWVKLKHYGKSKFEFNWKGPYSVVDVGFPGTYWLMTPAGLRLDSVVNESDLAPWLQPTVNNESFFYDGTTRRTNALRQGFGEGDSVTVVQTDQ